MDGIVLLQAECKILLLFGLGMLLKKLQLTNAEADQFLSDLLMNVLMPMNIFVSFYQSMSVEELSSCGWLVPAGALVVAVVMLCARLIPASVPLARRRIAEYCMLISNGSMVGIPLVESMYGPTGVFYANMFMVSTRILSNISGQYYFDTSSHGNGVKQGLKNFVRNPLNISMALGFLFNLLKVPVAVPVMGTCSSLAACMSPMAMILVGSTLLDTFRTVSLSQIFSGQVLGVSLFRLLASPYITLAACRLLGVQGVQCAAAVLINAAPVVNTATIYCQKYHGDMGFTNACVFVSTMLSFVTFWLIRF